MKYKLLGLIALCSLFINTLQGQNDISFDYKTFATHDSTTREDVKRLKKTDALYFEGNNYKKALPTYLNLNRKAPDFKPLSWRIAMCYFHTEQKTKALDYLLACDSTMNPMYLFYLAKAYHLNNDFEQAKFYYQDFKSTYPEIYYHEFYDALSVKKRHHPFDSIMSQLINACDIGLNNTNDSICYTFDRIAVVNKASNELSPVLGDNKLYFASDRKHSNGKYNTSQIYEIKYDSSEFIGLPKISSRVPYAAFDSRIPLCEDPNTGAFIYQSMEKGGDLLMAYHKKNKLKIKALSKFNTGDREGTACFVNDSTFIFSSTKDKKAREGDLYISTKDHRNKWGKPIKVDGDINSSGREEVITYYNGELFFISNGPASMGGFDIFKVPYYGNNQWGAVQNLGQPINTSDNDLSYIPLDSTSAIYCGVRPEGEGGTDIYIVSSSPFVNEIDTININTEDSLFIEEMKEELIKLDSLYANPDIIGEYENYNATIDSILSKEIIEDVMGNINAMLSDSLLLELSDSLSQTIDILQKSMPDSVQISLPDSVPNIDALFK